MLHTPTPRWEVAERNLEREYAAICKELWRKIVKTSENKLRRNVIKQPEGSVNDLEGTC